jgi:hypothetical protein
MKAKILRGAALGALALTLAGAGGAVAAYKLHLGWSPRPHFPAPLIEPAPKPGTWIFKTRLSPELEVRRGNWEMRMKWGRQESEEWNFARILQQMLRLGCEVVDRPKLAEELVARLYATRSMAKGPDILHRLTVVDSGCVIALEARGPAAMHTLRVTVSPPPPPRPKATTQPAKPPQ